MAVILFANQKGGAGKSTACLVLASALQRANYSVVVLDCDPNRPLAAWYEGRDPSTPSPFHVIADASENNVIKQLKALSQHYQFVLVDLEGAATLLVSRAMSRANLVIVPIQPSPLDTDMALKAVDLVYKEEETLERQIAHVVLFTRTTLHTRIEAAIKKHLTEVGVPLLSTHLNERSAFKQQFVDHKTIYELDPAQVSGLAKAIQNADDFVDELLSYFMDPDDNESAKTEEHV